MSTSDENINAPENKLFKSKKRTTGMEWFISGTGGEPPEKNGSRMMQGKNDW